MFKKIDFFDKFVIIESLNGYFFDGIIWEGLSHFFRKSPDNLPIFLGHTWGLDNEVG
jgi:hypothetical protein